ncbi:MAG: hypothetical protein ACXVIY_05310, partial [Mucilaginibacter sp.]
MRRYTPVLLCLIFTYILHGQVPSYIPYQAIARDGSGQIKANTPVQVEFKIFNTMLAGSSAYDELHTL